MKAKNNKIFKKTLPQQVEDEADGYTPFVNDPEVYNYLHPSVNKPKTKKGLTLVELMVALAIVGVMSAVLIPKIMDTYEQSTDKIVDIYNNDTQIICYCEEDILYEGTRDNMPDFTGEYKLIDIESRDGVVYMAFERLGE